MKVKSMTKKLAAAMALAMISAPPAFCFDTFEGTIEGANSFINKVKGPKEINDPHIAMERDFVLVTPDGEYFFMPNLDRTYKASAFKHKVRVKGKQDGAAIQVENFDVLKNNEFTCLWNRTEALEDMFKH